MPYFIQATLSSSQLKHHQLCFDLSNNQASIWKTIRAFKTLQAAQAALPTWALTLTPSFLDWAIYKWCLFPKPFFPHPCTDGEGSRVLCHFHFLLLRKPLLPSFISILNRRLSRSKKLISKENVYFQDRICLFHERGKRQ